MRRAKNSPQPGILIKWIRWINLGFIFLLLLTYATPYVNASKWGWLSLLALAYPFLLVANTIFAISWAFTRNWFAFLSIITLLGGFNYLARYVKLFSVGPGDTGCETSIQLMSYNMRGLSLVPVKSGAGTEAKIDSLYHAINMLGAFPDILCMQEGSHGELMAKKFGLPYTLHPPKSTLWILSRYPILKHGHLKGTDVSPSSMWADLETPQGILRVYNMHLVSNRVTNTAAELIEDMDLKNESTWESIRFIVNRYRQTTKFRAAEAKTLRNHLSKSPYPAVIAGDVNDTPMSNTYHVLAHGLKDSFKERGSGVGTTYESSLPLLRIDYLVGSPEIVFKNFLTHKLSYSDHYPISAGICLSTPPGS